jgi:hypothetical protein
VLYHRADGLAFLYRQYRANNLYMYPEHLDHDAGHNGDLGFGDLLPTNTPYLILSQGSSGSDQPFLQAFFQTLASFRPNVKQALIRAGLLMPTLQMIFRYSNQGIQQDGNYLTGQAHPAVFSNKYLASDFMQGMAREMRLSDVPPLVQLKVLEEAAASNGGDFFEAGTSSEILGDTPAVIARVFRGTAHTKRMVVSAADSKDLNQRELSYHWVVLRGDAQRIQIKPLDNGSSAEIILPYHERGPIWEGAQIESNRVDIGVFVHNGVYFSAPGFITFHFLDNEGRTYDASGRILEVFYNAGDTKIRLPLTPRKRTRWGAFFELLYKKENDLSGFLLEPQFDSKELAGIRQAGKDFIVENKRYVTAKTSFETAEDKRRQLASEVSALKK